MENIGRISYMVGLLVAIVLGIVTERTTTIVAILAALGLIVGVLNILHHETKGFLVASIALVVAAMLIDWSPIWGALDVAMKNVGLFSGTAAFVLAIRSMWMSSSVKDAIKAKIKK